MGRTHFRGHDFVDGLNQYYANHPRWKTILFLGYPLSISRYAVVCFLQVDKTIYEDSSCSRVFSTTYCAQKIISTQPRPLRKPHWDSANTSSSTISSLCFGTCAKYTFPNTSIQQADSSPIVTHTQVSAFLRDWYKHCIHPFFWHFLGFSHGYSNKSKIWSSKTVHTSLMNFGVISFFLPCPPCCFLYTHIATYMHMHTLIARVHSSGMNS